VGCNSYITQLYVAAPKYLTEQFKRKKVCFDSRFQRSQSLRAYDMIEHHADLMLKEVHSPPGVWEAKGDRGRVQGPNIPFNCMPSVT
jgi:hypothetical protein